MRAVPVRGELPDQCRMEKRLSPEGLPVSPKRKGGIIDPAPRGYAPKIAVADNRATRLHYVSPRQRPGERAVLGGLPPKT
jgi:hypothetical protein